MIKKKTQANIALFLLLATTTLNQTAPTEKIYLNEAYKSSTVLRFSSKNGWLELVAWKEDSSELNDQQLPRCLTTFWWDNNSEDSFLFSMLPLTKSECLRLRYTPWIVRIHGLGGLTDPVIVSYIRDTGSFRWSAIGRKQGIRDWYIVDSDLFGSEALNKDIEHDIVLYSLYQSPIFLLPYQKAGGSDNKYPTVTYIFNQTSSGNFTLNSNMAFSKHRVTPQNWLKTTRDLPEGGWKFSSANFICFKAQTGICGMFMNYIKQYTSSVYISAFAQTYGDDVRTQFKDSFMYSTQFRTSSAQRTYSGAWSTRTDEEEELLDLTYMMDLNKSEIRVCTPARRTFNNIQSYSQLFRQCDVTKMLSEVNQNQYITDVTFRKDVVGVYTYVDKSTNESKNGMFSVNSQVVLPPRSLDKNRVAANHLNLLYVWKKFGNRPMVEVFGLNNVEERSQTAEKIWKMFQQSRKIQ